MTGTAGSPPSAIFNNMYINADLGSPFATNTVSIAPTSTQNIQTGVNGTALVATESSTADSREWKWSTTSGSGYQSFSTAQTGISYTPNFVSAGNYYVICESTWGGSTEQSNEVQINVTAPVGIEELSFGKDLIYYEGQLKVLIQQMQYTVAIYNIAGQQIVLQPNLKSFNFINCQSGLYFIKIADVEGNTKTFKIVLQ